MKRLLALTALSLTAIFLVTSLAVGAGTTKSKTTSKVSPKRDKKKPYKFKTSGKVKIPTAFCPPNAPAPNCIPLKCPVGVTDAKYCTPPTLAEICTGKVKIVFKKGSKTRGKKTAKLKSNCTYSARKTIRRKGRMKVSVRFGGNTILAPSRASKKRARAG